MLLFGTPPTCTTTCSRIPFSCQRMREIDRGKTENRSICTETSSPLFIKKHIVPPKALKMNQCALICLMLCTILFVKWQLVVPIELNIDILEARNIKWLGKRVTTWTSDDLDLAHAFTNLQNERSHGPVARRCNDDDVNSNTTTTTTTSTANERRRPWPWPASMSVAVAAAPAAVKQGAVPHLCCKRSPVSSGRPGKAPPSACAGRPPFATRP